MQGWDTPEPSSEVKDRDIVRDEVDQKTRTKKIQVKNQYNKW